MTIFWLVLIFGIIIGGTYFMIRRKRAKKVAERPLTYSVDIPDACTEPEGFHQSLGGITVRSYLPVSDEALARIEAGIAHTVRNTLNLWGTGTPFSNLTEWQVFLVPPATHNVETDPGSPALLVKYLDAGGNVQTSQAAGTCMGVDGGILGRSDGRYPSIILPYEESELPDHANYLEESARNEAEHIRMWANNKAMYANYTGANDQHPIFPDEV